MRVLVTGGAGFMGRWVAREFVRKGCRVWVLDNLSNGAMANIGEFRKDLDGFTKGDVRNPALLRKLFARRFDVCVHLAASINVQASIDDPVSCYGHNVTGTFHVLEECRKHQAKMVFMSSALVYRTARGTEPIEEDHGLNPSCPYAASKIFGEQMTLAYHRTYDLPAVILRPFSIYGPWQRSDSEGGVMSIFIDRVLRKQPLNLYGTGRQSRDFFYVEDCARFVVKAALSSKADGEVLNAGSGQETRIRDLAAMVARGEVDIRCIPHHHPHAEIFHMRSSSKKAKRLLGWMPSVSLEEGMRRTREWFEQRSAAGL